MPRELPAYRDNLQDILDFSGGRRSLTLQDVSQYTGIKDYRTLRRHYPFTGRYISAPTLARCLAGGEKRG